MRLKNLVYLVAFIAFIGVKIAGHIDSTTGLGGQDISASPAVFTSQTSSTLASSGTWSATENSGQFIEKSTSVGPKFAFSLPEASQHFLISLSSFDKNMPSGPSVPVKLSFNDGYMIPLMEAGSQSELDAYLPDELVADWTHHFTADSEMTVTFPNSLESPWQFRLSGTTQTISAMANGINAAGITGLPAPWQAAPNPVSQYTAEPASTSTNEQTSQNNVEQPDFRGIPIPESQETLISMINSMINQYDASFSSAPNPVKADEIQQQYLEAFCAAMQNVHASDWVGVLDYVQNQYDGNRSIIGIFLKISFPPDSINYGGADADFSVYNDETTTIPVGTPLYDTVTNLRVGDTMVFSADFIPETTIGCEDNALDLFVGAIGPSGADHLLTNLVQFHDIEDTGH